MMELWRSQSSLLVALTICCLYLLNLSFCCSINDEGLALLRFKEKVVSDPYGALANWKDEVGLENPCSWVGVGCLDGYVVVLNLQDLCLSGSLAPDIRNLVHVKSIILRNNSFSGVIPEEILNLEELEVLDLGYNNISGPLLCHFDSNKLMGILLLDNNELLDRTRSEIFEIGKLSDVQAEDKIYTAVRTSSCNGLLISWNLGEMEDVTGRKLLQEIPIRTPYFTYNITRPPPPPSEFMSRASPPPPNTLIPSDPNVNPVPNPPPDPALSPSPELVAPPLLPSPDTRVSPPSLSTPTDSANAPKESQTGNRIKIVFAVTGGFLLLLLLIGGIFFFYRCNVATVNPWVTGLSGQLQRAFVTGVPKLKRSELVAACEDFSNVIGSSSVFTLYKGTLSSGVEIAVASIGVASAKEWPDSLEAQFRKKIDTLSRVNHKNFICLLGYCVDKDPFTRMMVFEYAPNGTLFEHLHIREAEHLDWATRLRIAMGVAYCFEHMHQLTPSIAHRNLTSSSIYLTEDYAGKVSDFIYDNEGSTAEAEPNTESDVYSFGVILFEMVTGRLPYTIGGESPENWASAYLRAQPLRELIDPTLRTYREDQLQLIGNVIKLCTNPDPIRRPSMKQVCEELRDITGISPDGAVPKLSSLWWAELEIVD